MIAEEIYEEALNLKNKKYVFMSVSIIVVIIITGYIYFTRPTLENICSEKGFTIVNQEPLDIVFSIPQSIISNAAHTIEGQVFEPNEIIVYENETSMIVLDKIMASENQDNVLKFDFSCSYKLEKNGKIVLPYWVREDGKFIWNSFIEPKVSLENDPQSYTLYLHTADTKGNFSVLVDKALCSADSGLIEISVSATEMLYMKGETEMAPNSEPMSEEKIVRILKSYRTSDIEILDVVQTPDSECGIVGVAAFRAKFSDDVYAFAFVRKDESPRELFYGEGDYPYCIRDLEYAGKDTVTYVAEIDRSDHKEIIKYSLTLEVNDKDETNFIHDIVEESVE